MLFRSLERDFRRIFGMNLRDFLLRLRMERAVELLDEGTGIAEIAYACGYSDHSAFTRSFRRMFGLSPSAYRGR